MDNSISGQRIKSERIRLKYNQSAFAKLGNVSQATQAAYESGSRTPDLAYLSLLLEKSDFDLHFVATGIRQKQDLVNIFDWGLFQEILSTIEYWAESKDLQITPEKKTDLIRALYGQFSETGEINAPQLQTILRLVS